MAGEGSGKPLSLLLVGESPVAGVGVSSHADGIGAATARVLASTSRRPVRWQAWGINGITVAQARTDLLPRIPASPVDIACVAFGVNDSTSFRRHAQWRTDILDTLDLLQQSARPRLILLAGVPPLATFPALPWPLRQVLGMKAASLDRALANIARDRPATIHVPFPASLSNPAYMASDGYHPSAAGCRYWAGILIGAIPAALLASLL
jgi:lysophospholipase L1-like esterase